jgi:transposase-like protein
MKTTKRQGIEKRTVQPTMRQAEFERLFATDDACMAMIVAKRWKDGVVRCPRCGSEKVSKLSKPWRWQCRQCNKNGYRFSPLVGTIFENTNVPLPVWFKVMFLMAHSKKGISALQIYRMIGGKDPAKKGSYRTAWYMCQRIRAAMKSDEFIKLTGVVEIDETFVGGKARNRHVGQRGQGKGTGTGWTGKTPVIGAIARKGNVIAQVIENTDEKTLENFVSDTVSDKVRLVATDDAGGYRKLKDKGLPHETVDHGNNEYVRGEVHTNSMESFWSLLKRGIIGTYHSVSKDYLPLYLNEFSFRFNNRGNADIFERILASA